ncbi:endosialidase catalytic beta-propeller domain-containing protein, partial [Sinorhizobium meliloti]|uniref:endosialidase catalytic beta-propeller domain-containing protein n=3 Tax=Rhizobium meliloti TaxID=382 RepID=UPI0019146052
MADVRIRDLPTASPAVSTDWLVVDNGSTRKVSIADAVNVGRPVASQAEAESGVENTNAMTPLTTKQAMEAYGLTKNGNLAGLVNTTTARDNLGLGSAAVESASSFATAAQGAIADTALQPADIGVSVGNMLKATYDPQSKNADAFLSSNTDFIRSETGAAERSVQAKLREYASFADFGAVGDGTTDDSAAVTNALAAGKVIDGHGLTYAVSSLPSNMLQCSNAAFAVGGIIYPSADFMRLELSKISSTPFYADWTQDKACTHKNKLIVPFQLAHGHTYDTTRIVWTISFDDGNTFSAPEIILDKHSNPATYGWNVFSAGVKDNRFVMVVEERNVSDSTVNALFMYDRVLDWSSSKTDGIALTAGSAIATISETAHGLMPGDKVSFSGVSGTDTSGLSGELTVVSVIDADRFTVNKGSNSATNQPNTGGTGWFLGASWYRNTWRITSMPLFPNNLGNALTHVHSFANKPNSSELFFGFHNGSAGTREAGVIHVQSFYGTPTFTKRRFPSTYETSAAEPCVRYVNSKLYATTRGQSSSSNGSSFLVSSDNGQNWTGSRFPGVLHYTPLPFEILDDGYAYIFGTERSENEWAAGSPDNRLVQTRPRSFMLKAPVAELEAGNFSNLQTTVLGYGIYEGEQTSSGCGVGSTIKTANDIWYFFGSEDWRVSTRYSYNLPTVDNEFIGQGYQPDIFSFRLRIKDRAGVNKFVLRAPDTRVLGQYRFGNNTKILAPLDIDRPLQSRLEAPELQGGRVVGRINYR